MSGMNGTVFSYFIIKGISDVPQLQLLLFLLVLIIYLSTLGGNMTILLLIILDHKLHAPMYFFLGVLSALDMFCSTVTLHNVLVMYVMGNNIISFSSCMTQLYFFSSFTSNELLILTAMSYDRYMAICNPLHYPMIMNRKTCLLLALVCWLVGFIEIIPYIVLLLRVSCYKSNVVNHFFCDITPVMNLSCSDMYALEMLIYTEGIFLLSMTPLLLTIISYVFIIVAIMRIPSRSGRSKTFYTCSSHLTVVCLLYGTLFCQYLRPASTDILSSNKIFSLFNTVAVPVRNPIIYSLKNETMKSAFKLRIAVFTHSIGNTSLKNHQRKI